MTGAVLVVLLAVAGCGYGFPNTRPDAAPGARSITLELFRNHTEEHGLEVRLRQAIANEFRARSSLRVVPDGSGDLVLRGRIRRFSTLPVAFRAADEAVEFQGTMRVSVRLVDRRSGRVLHVTDQLQATQEFGAVSGTVVTSSPSFQRGTIDARDLVNLTNAQIGPARRREAMEDLIDVLARDVFSRVMGDF